MGIRIEIVVAMAILFTIVITTMTELTDRNHNAKVMTKELEFLHTTFTEVDENQTKSKMFSTQGTRDNTILYLNNLKYTTPSIDKLLSNKAKYDGNILYLDGNVKLIENNGFIYTTNHANYDRESEVLSITSAFKAHMGNNIIYGSSLKYFSKKKETSATTIDAVIYTIEK